MQDKNRTSFNGLLTTTGIKKAISLLKWPSIWILKSFGLWWQLIWSKILHIKRYRTLRHSVCRNLAIKMNTPSGQFQGQKVSHQTTELVCTFTFTQESNWKTQAWNSIKCAHGYGYQHQNGLCRLGIEKCTQYIYRSLGFTRDFKLSHEDELEKCIWDHSVLCCTINCSEMSNNRP